MPSSARHVHSEALLTVHNTITWKRPHREQQATATSLGTTKAAQLHVNKQEHHRSDCAPANMVQQASTPLPAHKHPSSSRSSKQCVRSSAGQLCWHGSVPTSTSKNHIAIAAEAQPWTLGAPKGKATIRPQQHPQDLTAWVVPRGHEVPAAALGYSKGTTNAAQRKKAPAASSVTQHLTLLWARRLSFR